MIIHTFYFCFIFWQIFIYEYNEHRKFIIYKNTMKLPTSSPSPGSVTKMRTDNIWYFFSWRALKGNGEKQNVLQRGVEKVDYALSSLIWLTRWSVAWVLQGRHRALEGIKFDNTKKYISDATVSSRQRVKNKTKYLTWKWLKGIWNRSINFVHGIGNATGTIAMGALWTVDILAGKTVDHLSWRMGTERQQSSRTAKRLLHTLGGELIPLKPLMETLWTVIFDDNMRNDDGRQLVNMETVIRRRWRRPTPEEIQEAKRLHAEKLRKKEKR